MTIHVPQLLVQRSAFRTLEDALRIDPPAVAGSASLKTVDGLEPAPSRSTSFCCFWDENSLFVIFSVVGSRLSGHAVLIHTAETLRTPGLWELSEVVEVFVGAGARETGRYREFEVAPDGRWIALDVKTDSSGVTGNQDCVSGFRCAVARQPGKGFWRAAMEIPWSDLGGRRSVLSGNFYRSMPEDNGGELFAWSPTGFGPRCFHRPELFGDLVLSSSGRIQR
jgi:hypothetical protein